MTSKTYEPVTPHKVAFLGLGVMGAPMARHLLAAGHQVTVYNRTPSKAQDWVKQNAKEGDRAARAKSAATPREAAKDAQIVFCCVGNDADLRSVVLGPDGAFAGMAKGSLFVDHTTASADVARELYETAAKAGLEFVDAPVSGGQAAFDKAKPVAMAFSRACTRVGDAGAGQLAKMVNQICIAGLVQGLSEGINFGLASGLDMKLVLEVIGKGAAQSWQMDNRGSTMVDGKYDFGFAVDWMRKDLGLCLDEAKRNQAPLPVTALVDQFYGDVQAMGGKRWDTSSLIARLRKKTPGQ